MLHFWDQCVYQFVANPLQLYNRSSTFFLVLAVNRFKLIEDIVDNLIISVQDFCLFLLSHPNSHLFQLTSALSHTYTRLFQF